MFVLAANIPIKIIYKFQLFHSKHLHTKIKLMKPIKKLFTHPFGISRSPATLLVLAPMLDLTLLMSTLLPPLEGNSA